MDTQTPSQKLLALVKSKPETAASHVPVLIECIDKLKDQIATCLASKPGTLERRLAESWLRRSLDMLNGVARCNGCEQPAEMLHHCQCGDLCAACFGVRPTDSVSPMAAPKLSVVFPHDGEEPRDCLDCELDEMANATIH